MIRRSSQPQRPHRATPRGLPFFLWLVFIAVATLALPRWSFADNPSATLVGMIRDPSGQVLVGAQIRVVNEATSVERNGVTNETGSYRVPLLPVGVYQVEAAYAGFRTQTVKHVRLQVNEDVRVNITLPVEGSPVDVVVSAAPALVNTESSTVSTVVTESTGRAAARIILYGMAIL